MKVVHAAVYSVLGLRNDPTPRTIWKSSGTTVELGGDLDSALLPSDEKSAAANLLLRGQLGDNPESAIAVLAGAIQADRVEKLRGRILGATLVIRSVVECRTPKEQVRLRKSYGDNLAIWMTPPPTLVPMELFNRVLVSLSVCVPHACEFRHHATHTHGFDDDGRKVLFVNLQPGSARAVKWGDFSKEAESLFAEKMTAFGEQSDSDQACTFLSQALQAELDPLQRYVAAAIADRIVSTLVDSGDPRGLFGERGPWALLGSLQAEADRRTKSPILVQQLARSLSIDWGLASLRAGLSELRAMLNDGVTAEAEYQSWCQRNGWAFGHACVVRSDDPRQISRSDVVDLLPEDVASGFHDVIELKRPDSCLLNFDKSRRVYYLSGEASKAIGQCLRYLDALREQGRRAPVDHSSLLAHSPRATLVMGRSDTWTEPERRAFQTLERSQLDVSLMTYDHLLAQGERLIHIVEERSRREM